MPRVSMRQLLEAGVHFGHQTKRWNPKMKPYIYGARNGIYIINLGKTVQLFEKACTFVAKNVSNGGTVLFVGTKRQAQDIVVEEARRSNQYFITQRWLGGTLTNWKTMRKSTDRLKVLDRESADGTYDLLTKKEARNRERSREKLERNLGGIKNMERLPSVMFVIDPSKETIAVNEARILGIPVVAVVDTNCNPDGIDYIIPGNDDAIRAIRLFCAAISDACLEGQKNREGQRNSGAKTKKAGTYNAGPETAEKAEKVAEAKA